MTHEEKVTNLQEALDLLAQAEAKIREVGDIHLNKYVADQIDSEGRCLGTSLVGEIVATVDDLNLMTVTRIKELFKKEGGETT